MSLILWRRLKPLTPEILRTKWWCTSVALVVFSIICIGLYAPLHSYRSSNNLLQLDFVLMIIQSVIGLIAIVFGVLFWIFDRRNKNRYKCSIGCIVLYYTIQMACWAFVIFALLAASTINRDYMSQDELSTISNIKGVNVVMSVMWYWAMFFIIAIVPTLIAHLVRQFVLSKQIAK